MDDYDLCVIGGGPAGYAAAMRAIDLGLRTLLVERDRIGGTGIYDGALTSKTLWELSQRVSSANEVVRERGRRPFRLSWEEITRTVNEAVFERKYLYACHMQLLAGSTDRFRHERGHACFIGPHDLRIERPGMTTTIRARHFIIATGSRPRAIPGVHVDELRVMTSNGILHMDDLPGSIVIIGAGVIGCEFATILANFGHTQVHLIDRAERILPFEDADVSEVVRKGLESKGVLVHHSARLERLEALPHGVEYTLAFTDGRKRTIAVDRALLSVGRTPNLDGLGLDAAGVAVDPDRGCILVDGTRTSVPHIHAVGDVTGAHMLVNLGEMEGRHAAESIAGVPTTVLDHEHTSTIMFLEPEVAGVGLNEQECRLQGIAYRMARIDYSCLARAIAMRRTRGFFKVLVTDDEEMRVLGMRAVGEHASSAIQAVALMMHTGLGIRTLTDLVHPHPSIIEGVQECARILLGTSLFKPSVYGDKLRHYTWRPGPAEERAA
ncbi:MAG: NAD(P)/FAD-dependent oxidoreductase [Flavobacteriales bacterium]|nr:NAD(P)/FAD-dependent oxidoreductase [Flavobacteriales bacterium]MCB9194343.1 NAD(P)/FAD-dependent oxidoreductase [Flavobacteriales bacterium]